MQLSPEQLEATAIDDNLVVNAGAGSGKTTVLTHRYVRLLAEGYYSPEQIVSITFTRKAAREMRERIDLRLAEMACSGEEQWKQARDELVTAPIGTIHSFYARILRAFPVEAGIDPGFRVLEEMETGMLLSQALGGVFQGAVKEESPDLDILATVLGAQALEEEGSLAVQLRSSYQALLNRGIPIEGTMLSEKYALLPSWQECRELYRRTVDREAELASALAGKDKPDMIQTRRALVAAKELIFTAHQPRDLLAVYDQLLPLTKLKAGRTKGHKEFVTGAVENLRLLLSSALAPVLGEATLSLLIRLDQAFKEAKARVGGLDFSDLQLAVWRLLTNNPQVITKLRRRYRTYMIDEFQDTDRLQHKIISMLVEEDGDIPPGRLFVVGDEKQSIYRFRGADVRVFDQVRRKLIRDNPNREKRITCNYRSQPPLINLVNGLFSQLMDKAMGSEIEYINLTSHRTGVGPCAELVTCALAGDESTPEAEARTMAARLEELVTGGEGSIREKDSTRPLRYGDIAVLVRSRTHLKEYEHNLRLAGIPYTVVGGVGYYQQQEVQDVINLLRVVDNLRDELSLTAVLRSPLFALDDDSLLVLARARRELGGTLLDYGSSLEPEPRRRLERAAEIISCLRQARGRLEIPKLFEGAMELTLARELNLARFAGLQRYANLQKLLDLADQYSAIGNSLTGFLFWLDYAANLSEAEALVDSEESDSVKIMTIHASKGLEFPVVFLPVCSSALQARFGSMLVDEDGALAFKAPWQCAIWEEVCQGEHSRELEEYKRLLYVAVTRARDRFVALVRETDRNETSFNIWLQEYAGDSPQHFHFHLAQSEAERGRNIQLPAPLPEPGEGEHAGVPQTFPGLKSLGIGRRAVHYFSISQFMLWRQDRQQFDRRYLSRWLDIEPRAIQEQGNNWEHEPGGASFGSLLHDALEVTDCQTDIDALLRELVPKYFPGADRIQQDRVFYSARTLLEAYQKEPGPQGEFIESVSEQEFYYRLGDALFYGLIDRVLLAKDHIAILDYKSNRIPQEGIEPLLETYTPQLQFYALAAERIYKKPVRAYLQLLRMPPGKQLAEIFLGSEELHALQTELEQFLNDCR